MLKWLGRFLTQANTGSASGHELRQNSRFPDYEDERSRRRGQEMNWFARHSRIAE